MPSFLKDLRRKSRSFSGKSIPIDDSAPPLPLPQPPQDASSPSNQSSTTVDTAHGSSTPPSTVPSEQSQGNSQPQSHSRPSPPPHNRSNRFSVANGSGSFGTPIRSPAPSASPYAPRILSVSDGSWILLVYGQIADPALQAIDGQLWVCHHQDSFPATSWPVYDSHFKALVHLQPGPNRIRVDFVSPKVQGPGGVGTHSSWTTINYLPLSAPPLDLVILLAKDSPGTYDAVPERKQREGNDLKMAIKKFRMAAYLWQAFTGEQMNRNAFGRRCFRFEEVWQPGTLSSKDVNNPVMRSEAKIHVVRTTKTVAELRDLDLAQQHGPAQRKGELFDIAMAAVKDYFQVPPGQTRYVSVLLLDSHWDHHVIRAHAALGGGDGQVQLAIFGSHALQTYPSCLEEVVPAFTDCTRTDTAFVANDCNESGSNWEAANIGIGAHLHETGHLFGCPHQAAGVMLRDYVRLNRTFTLREPYATRTKSQGPRLALQQDECAWHRLDCLRFRFHPCFRLPADTDPAQDDSVAIWAVDGAAVLTAAAGIAWVEVYAGDAEAPAAHLEYLDGASLPRQLTLTEAEVRARIPDAPSKSKFRLVAYSPSGQRQVDDLGAFVKNRVKLPHGRTGWRGAALGHGATDGSRPAQVILHSAVDGKKLLRAVKVWAGAALDGLEFCYEDGSVQLFGNRGGSSHDFALDTRRGETLFGLYVRAGAWVDGVQLVTSLGRRSPVYGNAQGGSGHTLIPPRGYSIAGVAGSCGAWVDGLALVIAR